MSFWEELKRRHVVKVAITYAVVAWLLLQVTSTLIPAFDAPAWVLRVIVLVLALGFVLTVVLAWVYDVTPGGVRRTGDESGSAAPSLTGRRLNYLLTVGLIVAVAYFIAEDRFLADDAPTGIAAANARVLENSVAVLPFASLSADSDNAFFATGFHDELLNQLAKIRDLNVIARTSVLRYGDGATPIEEIARALNVETVMEGTVRYADGNVRVTTQLIDGTTGTHLWSETYTRPFENIFEIETEIAMQIAAALEAEFSLAEQQVVGTQLTSSAEAWSLYVSAVELWQSTGPRPDVLATVNERLDAAIRFDPEFAAAYGVKADIAAELLFTDLGTPDDWQARSRELFEQANEWARTAIRLDPTYGYPYSVLGKLNWQNWAVEAAADAHDRAIELSPNDPEALIEYAWFNAFVGRYSNAMRAAERVAELDPGNADLLMRVGQTTAMSGDYARAAEFYRRSLAADPAYDFSNVYLAIYYARRGDYAEARALVETAGELLATVEVGWMLGNLAYGYGMVGLDADAQRVFDRIQQLSATRRIGPITWVWANLGIGDDARALEWIERAAADRFPDEGSMLRGLVARNLQNDPRLEQPEFVAARMRLTTEID